MQIYGDKESFLTKGVLYKHCANVWKHRDFHANVWRQAFDLTETAIHNNYINY